MTDLSQIVFESQKFRDIIWSIRLRTLHVEFPMIAMDDEPAALDWNYALLCASALSSVPTERAQNTVLRVAAACLSLDDSDEAHKSAATALLDRVGNHRSVELAESRNLVQKGLWKQLPPLLRLETIGKRLQLSIPLSTGENLAVNSFQSDFWKGAEDYDWVSVSAPTSAGKSRIVREWFLEQIRQHDRYTAVYLAPTRALVEEVSADFREAVPASTGVFVMPWDPDLDRVRRRVLVLTQERLHLIQQSRHPFEIDLLFVDEAQGLGSAERGVLLQQVLDRAVEDRPALQVIFASPLSANPAILLSDKPATVRSQATTSEAVTVNQNLLRVEGVHRAPANRVVSLVDEGQAHQVASFKLQQRATRVPMRIAYVAHALGGNGGGNIVYVNGADDAEKVAKNIADLRLEVAEDEEIENLQELVRTAVHPKYSLADALAKRIAFHYGNMPLTIRSEIERLFGEGKIEFLVCTSTLLEGVNLPCRTIFMRNPQKGRGKPLSEADFWNLAGRAGRWGKEFQGNIVCVDTDDESLWPNLPTVRRRSDLKLATHHGLRDAAPLIAYARSDFAVGSDPASEILFAYLAAQYSSGRDITHHLERMTVQSERLELQRALVRSVDDAQFPHDLIPRHAGISPIAMQRLLERFRETEHDPHELALPLPEEQDSRQRYQDALVLIGQTMTTAFGRPPKPGKPDRRKWQLANLVVNWMQGMPLARLIEQRATGNTPIARAIRDVLSDIETVARFQAPKYLSCYSDVLAVYAAERGVHDVGHGQDITMLLELGVSRSSEVVLMSLGMSRTATIALSQYVTADNWTSSESLDWLRHQNIEGMDIPVLIQKEILDLIAAQSAFPDKA
ncbi:DEAD/DEAH box helicase [Rhodococcus jostii]|uniref:Helicase conserved C-terminal domain-containing protein n=1 Tax=Rhodococcus jostii TaxID=132919 RepID=A0A1H4J7K1_RHOJO|nr:DEAD/DEAH box helicase [Rhodococcus jostii]SEB42274.1 Helicase conserved C-terminal domain-containing protein [Rhodococcus jostii]